jgi:hypothetical protein
MQKLLFLLFGLLSICACNRDTCVSGKVTDMDTGEPMKDFNIILGTGYRPDLKTTTDIEGNYYIESPKSKRCNMSIFAYRYDCERQSSMSFDGGGDHIFDFQFKYTGSSLELKVVNSQNTPSNFYSCIVAQVIGVEKDYRLYSEPYPLIIPSQDSIIYVYKVPKGETTLNYNLVDIKDSSNSLVPRFYFEKNTVQQYEIRY